MAQKNALAIGYYGAGFDGRYLYLVQQNYVQTGVQGFAARFEAKNTSWLPRRWNASFL
jgi:hypothetical protein